MISNAYAVRFSEISATIKDLNNFSIDKLKIKNGYACLSIKNHIIKNDRISITLENEIDIKKLTAISYEDISNNVSYNTLYSSNEFDTKYYTEIIPGLHYQNDFSEFYVWSPAATSVNLLIYQDGDISSTEVPEKFKMTEQNGLWHVKATGNLKDLFYTFEIHIHEKVNETVDPYAAAVGVNGHRSAILDTKYCCEPDFFNDCTLNLDKPTDAIIYEISIRDISIHPDSNIKHKGKYLGLTEENTYSSKTVSTGLQHIIDLGVTHVQIMPFYDFSYIGSDEKHPYKYNWGYEPQNYNVPEGIYSMNPFIPSLRINEAKQMISTFHKNNIGVIMDVTYNHVFHYSKHAFNKVFPGYYYRYDDNGELSNGSGCGNDIASERSMVREYIINSISHWAKEYHIDGFRFDLLGLLDITTINTILKKLKKINPDILLYGEGWNLGTSLPETERATINNSSKMPHISFFNDKVRDNIKGNVFSAYDSGFVNGKSGLEQLIKYCVAGSSLKIDSIEPMFLDPFQSVNYTSCHDNHTLWDKLKITCPNSDEAELAARHILADGIILTSQGIPLIQSGADFCRTKDGIENSYDCSDIINRLDWNRKYNFKHVFKYYQGLIKLRNDHPAFRIKEIKLLKEHLSFIENTPPNCVGFILSNYANKDTWGNIAVVYNANTYPVGVKLPKKTWHIVVNKAHAGTDSIGFFKGSETTVESLSINVFFTK